MPASLHPGVFARPLRVLTALLLAVAAVLGAAALTARPADAASTTPAATAIRYAMAQIGDPYAWGATGPSSFDCSGLTLRAYQAAGISLPRTSRDQWNAGPKVSRDGWKPGDLIFWASDTRRASSIYHVGIYLGGGMVLHSPRTGKDVQIAKIWTTGLMSYAVRPAGLSAKQLLTVRPGVTGDAARDVQTRLRANGYGVAVTGVYDGATEAAVVDFQRSLGYSGVGSVGPKTWALLVQRGAKTTNG